MDMLESSRRSLPPWGNRPLTPPCVPFGIRRFPGNVPRVVLVSLSSVVRLSTSAPTVPCVPRYWRLGSHRDDGVVRFSQCSTYGNQQLLTPARGRSFPSRVLWTLLTSHRPRACRHAPLSPSQLNAHVQTTRPPRIGTTTFIPSTRHIFVPRPMLYRASLCLARPSSASRLVCDFYSTGGYLRPAFSDSTSRWTPLLFANSSYCQVCSGLSPPRCVHAEHTEKS